MSTKLLKAFITRDDFTVPGDGLIAPIFEISELSRTYSLNMEAIYPTDFNKYIIHSFDYKNIHRLTQQETNLVTFVVHSIVEFASTNPSLSKTRLIHDFLEEFNNNHPTTKVTGFDFSGIVSHGGVMAPNYMVFTVKNIDCHIWLSESYFSRLYPWYDIKVVLPFMDFKSLLSIPNEMVNRLKNFNLVEFNNKIDYERNGKPQTTSKTYNIPYVDPNTKTSYPCYFGFNVYGIAGDNELILRQELYKYLRDVLGIEGTDIEELFPTILDVNEFFIVPRWNDIAIPSRVGLGSINSQVSLAYADTFNTHKFVEVYQNTNFVRDNTYKVPFDYNNINLMVVNGLRSNLVDRDFRSKYPDIISVGTTHMDFSRMSTQTQQLMIILDRMLSVCDSVSQIELLTKLINISNDFQFSITTRRDIEYLSVLHNGYIWYMLPKYEMIRIGV